MMIATTNDLAGYEITEVLGEVFGLTVRSRNVVSQLGSQITSMFGGELKGMTQALTDSRHQVIERMVAEAEANGMSVTETAALKGVSRSKRAAARSKSPSLRVKTVASIGSACSQNDARA